MLDMNIQNAIDSKNEAFIIEALEDKALNIELVKKYTSHLENIKRWLGRLQ